MSGDGRDLRRRNILLALAFGLFALVVFFTSFPFWMNLFRMVGGQVK